MGWLLIDSTMILLSFAFAATWTVTSAMAAHLPRIVEVFGATLRKQSSPA